MYSWSQSSSFEREYERSLINAVSFTMPLYSGLVRCYIAERKQRSILLRAVPEARMRTCRMLHEQPTNVCRCRDVAPQKTTQKLEREAHITPLRTWVRTVRSKT